MSDYFSEDMYDHSMNQREESIPQEPNPDFQVPIQPPKQKRRTARAA